MGSKMEESPQEGAINDHMARSGGLIAVLPNTPLIYYPDILQETGLIVYLLAKLWQLVTGNGHMSPSTPALQVSYEAVFREVTLFDYL